MSACQTDGDRRERRSKRQRCQEGKCCASPVLCTFEDFCVSPVLHVVLRSCLLHKQHALSSFKGISAFPGKHTEQNGGLVPPVSQCRLSVHHMHAMHFLKSPNMHYSFAFLSITLACPRLFDKQALQQSVFDHVNELTKVAAASPRSARQTEPSNNFPAGHRERPVALGTAQFVVSPAPTHDNSQFITTWRRRRS